MARGGKHKKKIRAVFSQTGLEGAPGVFNGSWLVTSAPCQHAQAWLGFWVGWGVDGLAGWLVGWFVDGWCLKKKIKETVTRRSKRVPALSLIQRCTRWRATRIQSLEPPGILGRFLYPDSMLVLVVPRTRSFLAPSHKLPDSGFCKSHFLLPCFFFLWFGGGLVFLSPINLFRSRIFRPHVAFSPAAICGKKKKKKTASTA